jgi:uncharacterized membrane protein YhaH (DUF805 family)
MSWFVGVYKKYAVFSGRARRKEYWFFSLFFTIALVLLAIADGISGTMGLFSGVYLLGSLLPAFAVTVRRLHDTDRSGWWALITFIPLIGVIVLLVFCCLDSSPGLNRFGANPKLETASL